MLFTTTQIANGHVPVHRNAIVTMAIGDVYVGSWVKTCQPGWVKYAIRHGFDIILINAPLDRSDLAQSRSPAWQKLLILEQPWARSYERVIWLDSDIMINPTAPNILNSVPNHRLFGVTGGGGGRETGALHIMTECMHNTVFPPETWPTIHRSLDESLFRDTIGIEVDSSIRMYNTGVLVIHTEHHRTMMLRSYEYNTQSRLYEQPGLSYEICRSGQFCEFSQRFNWYVLYMRLMYFPETWGGDLTLEKYQEMLPWLRKEFGLSYFLHFASCIDLMLMIQEGDMELGDKIR